MNDDTKIAHGINVRIGEHAKQFRREVEEWLDRIRAIDACGDALAKTRIRDHWRDMCEAGDLVAIIALAVFLRVAVFDDRNHFTIVQ